VVTQLQFNKINGERIHSARVDTYLSDIVLYNLAKQSNDECMIQINVNLSHIEILKDMSALFQKIADLPTVVLPANEKALAYQSELTRSIENMNSKYFDDRIPLKSEDDCPKVPANQPTPP
jgi:phosphopantetheine adenylyltransferase